jgi:glycerol kinase
MQKDSGIKLQELRVDGGASHSEPLLQFQADLLQSPVVRPSCVETTAMGAAYMAGLAVGYWDNRDAITANWQIDRTFQQQRKASEMKKLQQGWDKALERSKSWEEAES